MRKILIAAKDLKIGGIEKSLITLINYLLEHNYEVKLVLESKEGELLKKINRKIKIIEYAPSSNRIIIFRKFINLLKKIKFLIRYKNKFDVSISYATYSKVGSFAARNASKNSILWCHADYLELFKQDKEKVIDFFEDIYYDYFKKIVFVSKKGKDTFKQIFPRQKNVYYCNNLINSREI